MNTRNASEDSPFRQERYMSSPEIQRGLLANCVAARVQFLSDSLHRKLVWWLQRASWQPGGLDKVAEEIATRWPERFVTRSMMEIGFEKGRIYSAEEVQQVRSDIPQARDGNGRSDGEFLLKGEGRREVNQTADIHDFLPDADVFERRLREQRDKEERSARPAAYPAEVFVEKCRDVAQRHFAKFLFERLCLDPSVKLDRKTLWYLPLLVETLSELHDLHSAAAANRAPVTEIGASIGETLEYALAQRGLVVVDGLARTGKTFAVKAWCDAHPGQARYVQVPSSNDDMGFFRAICEALGLGSSLNYKAAELRFRIDAAMHGGDLLLVLDEGHYLWPQRNMRKAIPHRINWMLTQLVNMGVPVAVVTTPQFTKSQEALVRNGGWSSEQFVGRIIHYNRLPDALAEEDLEAVAQHWLPDGDEKTIRLLITYAQSSEKYLQGIDSLVRRARFLAHKAQRAQPTFADVAAALKEGVVPSDNALSAALAGAQPGARRKPGRPAAATIVQAACTPPARTVQPAFPTPSRTVQPVADSALTPVRDTGDAVLST